MLRIVLFLVLIALAGAGAAWVADQPGEVVLTWGGWRASPTIPVFVLLLGVFAVAIEFGGDFFLGKWIELFQEHDRGAGVFSLLSLGLQFVANFSGADQDAFGFAHVSVGKNVEEVLVGEVLDGRAGVGVAEHALGREHYQGLAPVAQSLATQEMEILRGV